MNEDTFLTNKLDNEPCMHTVLTSTVDFELSEEHDTYLEENNIFSFIFFLLIFIAWEYSWIYISKKIVQPKISQIQIILEIRG